MTKYTPGPWTCHSGMVWKPCESACTQDLDTPIAHMDREPGNGTMPTERDANAHLIAAAPEMLEALQVLIGFAEAHNGETYVKEHLKMARAAIAKAEGK